MDPFEQIEQLRGEVTSLRAELNAMRSAPELDPDKVRAMLYAIFRASDASPSNYDKSVNESGSSNYNVADVPDGFYLVGGRLVPYYTP